MKILQVIPYFCFGGAETMCENLTYALQKLGHEVLVVSLHNEHTPISQRMEQAGVRIVYLDKKFGMDVSMFGKLYQLMKQERPDVVHTHLHTIKYAVAAAKLAGIRKCVHTVHTVAQEEAEGRIQKIINHVCYKLHWSTPVALNPRVRDTIAQHYNLPEDRIPIVYNGVDLTRCIPKENYEVTDALTLIHIGRFIDLKNHDGLLRAFRKFQMKYPNSRLHLLGDGELYEQTVALAKELELADSVRFFGSQSDVYPYLHEADVFVLPSHYEGMPMTIIEAMGTGLPIVAANVGGIPDMVTDGETALLTAVEDDAVCAACVRLAEDPQLRRSLGEKARKESARFSSEFMAQEYCWVYQKK